MDNFRVATTLLLISLKSRFCICKLIGREAKAFCNRVVQPSEEPVAAVAATYILFGLQQAITIIRFGTLKHKHVEQKLRHSSCIYGLPFGQLKLTEYQDLR